MNNNEIYHFGVKGMRWGVRKARVRSGSGVHLTKKRLLEGEKNNPKESKLNSIQKKSRKKTKRRSTDAIEKSKRKKALEKRRTLSNEELESRIKRLETEKKYRQLAEEDLNPGRAAVKSFMKSAVGKVATTAMIGGLVYAGKVAMTKKFDINEAANFIFPNPNKKK